MVVIPINEKIHKAVAALDPGTIFEARKLGVGDISSRRISSILKTHIRCPDNPNGDLLYEKGVWMKLEPVNA